MDADQICISNAFFSILFTAVTFLSSCYVIIAWQMYDLIEHKDMYANHLEKQKDTGESDKKAKVKTDQELLDKVTKKPEAKNKPE